MTDHWTGPEITRRRINHKLSKRQLADAVGVSAATIARWESLDRPPIEPRNRERLTRTLTDQPTGTGSVVWDAAEIVRRRKLKGMSQEALAVALGRGKRTIQGWEAGDTSPSGRDLAKLHELLTFPEEEPSPIDGVPLREASFTDVMLRLIELHNAERRAAGRPALLDFDGVYSDVDAHEHDRAHGPATERVDVNRTDQDNIDSQ